MTTKSKKSKPPQLSAAKLVRTKARAQLGPVPPTKLVPDKRHRPEKHRPDLSQL